MKLKLQMISTSTVAIICGLMLSANANAASLTLNAMHVGIKLKAVSTCNPGWGKTDLFVMRISGAGGPTGWILVKSDIAPACTSPKIFSKKCASPVLGSGSYMFRLDQGADSIVSGTVICP